MYILTNPILSLWSISFQGITLSQCLFLPAIFLSSCLHYFSCLMARPRSGMHRGMHCARAVPAFHHVAPPTTQLALDYNGWKDYGVVRLHTAWKLYTGTVVILVMRYWLRGLGLPNMVVQCLNLVLQSLNLGIIGSTKYGYLVIQPTHHFSHVAHGQVQSQVKVMVCLLCYDKVIYWVHNKSFIFQSLMVTGIEKWQIYPSLQLGMSLINNTYYEPSYRLDFNTAIGCACLSWVGGGSVSRSLQKL